MTNRPTITLSHRPELDGDRRLTLAEIEHEYIEQTVSAYHGNLTQAAIALGIDRRTLYRKLALAHPKGRLFQKLRQLRDDYAAGACAIQEVE